MTATVTEEETGIDITELIDFEKEVPCDGGPRRLDEPCPDPAVFRHAVSCCGTVVLLCEDCTLYAKAWLARHTGKTKRCVPCGARIIVGPEHLIFLGRL